MPRDYSHYHDYLKSDMKTRVWGPILFQSSVSTSFFLTEMKKWHMLKSDREKRVVGGGGGGAECGGGPFW